MSQSEKSGYVYSVSLTKRGGTSRYFLLQLQTGDSEFAHGVCYDEMKKTLFQSLEKSKSPVKMKNVAQKRGRNEYVYDVIISKRCQVNFDFDNSHTDENTAVKRHCNRHQTNQTRAGGLL